MHQDRQRFGPVLKYGIVRQCFMIKGGPNNSCSALREVFEFFFEVFSGVCAIKCYGAVYF